MIEETVHGKVIAKKNAMYTVYVFQLDDDSLRMCTLLSNWGPEYNLNIGDSGFLTTQFFEAGESYYDRTNDVYNKIKYTNVYLKEFIKDNKQSDKIIL